MWSKKISGFWAVLFSGFCLLAAIQAETLVCPVDDHVRELPGQPPGGWFYNRMGGDRGLMYPGGVAQWSRPEPGTYRGEIVSLNGRDLWEWFGMWYALGHPKSEKVTINTAGIFSPIISAQLQPRITGFNLNVRQLLSPSGRHDLKLTIMLKSYDAKGKEKTVLTKTWKRSEVVGATYPKVFSISFDPSRIGEIGFVSWVLDRAVPGDAIEVNGVDAIIDFPVLPTANEAFLISLGQLLENYDNTSGMVNDRTCFPKQAFENVTATGKLAKILAMAKVQGVVDPVLADAAILRISNALLRKVPTGPVGVNTLWPHFTTGGGTKLADNAEYASGDTAYALLDLIVALRMIDADTKLQEAISHLEGIDWAALRTPQGGFYHGYYQSGTLKPGTWTGAGAETMGVLMAAYGGKQVTGVMAAPPSDTGSGFIWHVAYPIQFTGVDRFGNDWSALRAAEVQEQAGWYSDPTHGNDFFATNGLFGLSAGEKPLGWDANPDLIYYAYGLGGKLSAPLFTDEYGDVVVGHYIGLAAPLQLTASTQAWNGFKALRLITPINNLESISVNRASGTIGRVNSLKGSWNLALQTEGWGFAFQNVANAVNSAVRQVPELASAYDYYFPRESSLCVVYTDRAQLYRSTLGDTPVETQYESTAYTAADNPEANGTWLWFDALAADSHRRLWRLKLTGDQAAEQMTTDPWGNSYDDTPVPSPAHDGVLYYSNRTGMRRLTYSSSGSQGPGDGTTGPIGGVAVWGTASGDTDSAYVALVSSNVLSKYTLPTLAVAGTIPYKADLSLSLVAQRLSLKPDGTSLLISTSSQGIYMKPLPDGDATQILSSGQDACFSPDGSHIAYAAQPAGKSNYEIFVGAIDAAGNVSAVRQITAGTRNNYHPTWCPSPIPILRPVLKTTVAGTGVGTVTLSPPDGSYEPGTEVTLTANPASGYAFGGWSGDATGTDNPVVITMDKDKFVTAMFVATTTVNRLRGSMNFKRKGGDTFSIAGTIQQVSPSLNRNNLIATVSVGGARASFTLNAKGIGKGKYGSFVLKLPPAGSTTGTFVATCKGGGWLDAWVDEDVVPVLRYALITMPVRVTLGDIPYATTATVAYSPNGRIH